MNGRAIKDNSIIKNFKELIKVQSFQDGNTYVVYFEDGKVKEHVYRKGEIDYISSWCEDSLALSRYLFNGVEISE